MAVPWTGFPLHRLVEFAEPRGSAKYLRMVSFYRPEDALGWYGSRRVFHYYEALTLEEALHDLAFLVTGIYGRPLPPQHGAPLRLAVPWKYGFKSIKSILAFQFTREQSIPVSHLREGLSRGVPEHFDKRGRPRVFRRFGSAVTSDREKRS